MDTIQLERFALGKLLGFGADYEVHAAQDQETGRPVVVRRPKPTEISRGWHHGVDDLSQRIIEMHESVGNSMPYITHLIGYTGSAQNGAYFGDSHAEEYLILVEERAKGIPLVADIRDKFLGAPIGLGQNLFALYPLVAHPQKGDFVIHHQLLEVEEALHKAGYLLLDMRPQNVYFDPLEGRITIIDFGALLLNGEKGKRGEPRDIQDFFVELFKFYISPHDPHSSAAGYRDFFGMRPTITFEEEVKALIRAFSGIANADVKEAAITLLEKIQQRSYNSFEVFAADFDRYLTALEESRRNLPDLGPLVDAWGDALALLREDYWRKYLFDADVDLDHYQAAVPLRT